MKKTFVSKNASKSDLVNHPKHYTMGKIEVIDAIEDWMLDFHCGSAVKYVARSSYKGEFVQDLQKAIWYLQRRILLAEVAPLP